jgi:8-hydroxy-5-deazaflavin:NADPH oxidoreductase
MKSGRRPDRRRRDLLKAAAGVVVLGAFEGPSVAAAAEPGPMKIGMIGSGNVGSALGRVWARAGHRVMFSSRHLENDQRLAAEIGANARAGTPAEAAAFGEVLVFAVPYGALPELGRSL